MSLFLKAVFVFVGFMLLAHATPVFAQGGGPAGIPLIEYMFARVVCVAVPLGYTALLVVLVIAGLKYLTSGGEAKAVQAAHQTVTWGLLGILFLAIAWLVLLLIQNFTGVEVTKFNVASLPGVQGFSGQCLGPSPLAPEPPKPIVLELPKQVATTATPPVTTEPSQQPTQSQNSDIVGERCYTVADSDLSESIHSPESSHKTDICLVSLKDDVCAKIITPFDIAYPNTNLFIYTNADDLDEFLNVLSQPIWVKTLIGSLDNRAYGIFYYTRIPREVFNFTFQDGGPFPYARIMGKFEKDKIPKAFLVAALKARAVAFRLSSAVSERTALYGVSCPDADYYEVDVQSPLVYLYPTQSVITTIRIKSPFVSQLLPTNHAWLVIASPDGTLTTLDGKKYRYIPYEFLRSDFRRPEKGFVVEGNKIEDYLRNDFWKKLGLTEQEIEDYWADTKGRVKPSPYYFISLIDRSEIDRVLPMEVNPQPDTIIRNMTYILPLPQAPSMSIMPLEEEKLKASERKGFTVLENGVFTDGF